jgi:hypothetical protein
MISGLWSSYRGDADLRTPRGCALPLLPDGLTALCAQLNDSQKLAREFFKELIEINTTHSVANTATAAKAMAARLQNAGFAGVPP